MVRKRFDPWPFKCFGLFLATEAVNEVLKDASAPLQAAASNLSLEPLMQDAGFHRKANRPCDRPGFEFGPHVVM